MKYVELKGEKTLTVAEKVNFNSKVEVKEATNIIGSLKNCKLFDCDVSIPSSVTFADELLMNCKSFNSKITIKTGVKTLTGMLANCENFNQFISIPDSVVDCSCMLSNCKAFNKPVIIPESATVFNMFEGCTSMRSNVYFTKEQFSNSGLKVLGYSWEDGIAICNREVGREDFSEYTIVDVFTLATA